MVDINAALIRQLRECTGAGIMECKKVLIEVNGNIDLAIENMRKSSSVKALKKANNIAINGIIRLKIFHNYGAILELNCETDFVTKNINFLKFADKLIDAVGIDPEMDLDTLVKTFEEERITLVAKIGENIQIKRLSILKGNELGSYLHRDRIGVLISGFNISNTLIKNIAMHIAASDPKFIKPENIPINILEKEYEIQNEIAIKSSRSHEIAEKIVKGRMKKFKDEISLIGQIFVMDTNKTVNQVLEEQDAEIIDFIRFEVGEKTIQDISKVNIGNKNF
ncbi:elongation factor Ts [Candidatus Pantoea edessiphila]|uniref:Elongation factor Ts n=1 Tax=Candidatus Pantoea edessiphila TaxID=2044610 RepID=A0A2P5T076_9GAMM|nr:translation elongation factor Ts [Candidatus Pantoea edessiphila]PPI87998.1 elongation factor Ts [Candidatus Pantoea edessiphila]